MAGWIKIPLGKEVGLCPVPKRLCVRWGTQLPSSKREQSPQFSAHVYCGQTYAWINGTWHEGRSRPRPHSARWGPAPPPPKVGGAPNFWPMSVVTKWLHWSRCHLVWR